MKEYVQNEYTENGRGLVVVPQLGSATWGGGFTYVKNLLAATSREDIGFDVRVLAPESGMPSALRYVRRAISLLSIPLLGYDALVMSRLIHSLGGRVPDVAINLPVDADRIARVVWVPDLQHRRLPEMFTVRELRLRNRSIARSIRTSRVVVVSSLDAQRDVMRYFSVPSSKIVVAHFVASVDEGTYDIDIEAILSKYDLPGRYFFLPNQFWKHKNHALVIRALSLLTHSRVSDMLVVCSVKTTDYRNPGHLQELLELIDRLGVSENIRILGEIPLPDIMPLMRGSIALINPSLFEGWSTTVEEAKSLGVPLILSDIDVHREQNPPKSLFFRSGDAEALAASLEEAWLAWPPGPDQELEAAARRNYASRQREYSFVWRRIFERALDRNQDVALGTSR